MLACLMKTCFAMWIWNQKKQLFVLGKTMTSITSSDSREVWLSGTEAMRMVHELVGIEKDPQAREVGRTTRMAVKLAHIALSVPDHKVIVKDHFESEEADHALVRKVAKIL